MRTPLIILALTMIVGSIPAQNNLVPNYSFEQYDTCPSNLGQITRAFPWFKANLATTDFFNSCSSNPFVQTSSNFFGSQVPITGNGYAGIASSRILTSPPNAREYLQVRLTSQLVANKSYCIEFSVSLADSFDYAISTIGMYLSNISVFQNNYNVLPFVPQVLNSASNLLSDKINWEKIQAQYIASGGEEFIVIGNFNDDQNTDTTYVGGGCSCYNNMAYYYIDDVYVTEVVNAEAGPNLTVCTGDSIQISATPTAGAIFTWSPTTGLSNPLSPNPKASPSATTTYFLTQVQCNVTTIDSITITVNDCSKNDIFIPTAFSPNGDGNNDVLFVRGKNLKEIRFAIYDRWGEKIFETANLNVGWDGKYKDRDMNNAVFSYFLNATYEDGSTVTQKGNISLIK